MTSRHLSILTAAAMVAAVAFASCGNQTRKAERGSETQERTNQSRKAKRTSETQTTEQGQATELRLMSYNIRAGKGMDDVRDLERIAEVIKAADPDYVGLQEVDSVAARSGLIDQAAELGRLTGMHAYFAGAIPYSEGKYGIAALVKEKPLNVRTLPLPGEEEARALLILEYPDFLLCNTHLSLTASSRLESIGIIGRIAKEYSKPAVINGDFNMEPDEEAFAQMCSDWDALSDTALPTFPADEPAETLDYFWGLKGFAYTASGFKVLDEPTASDHRPLTLTLTVRED